MPTTMLAVQFWSMCRSLYKRHWCVRIEECYAHGKGVVLCLARYCKAGPVHQRKLKQMSSGVVTMSYLDYRDKRIKQQRLKTVGFINRLLHHVLLKVFISFAITGCMHWRVCYGMSDAGNNTERLSICCVKVVLTGY